MIKLTLEKYYKKLGEEKKIVFPTEHYYEDDNLFMLFFKSREKWEYYTVVLKKDILEYDQMTIDEFRINYCSNLLEINELPFYIFVETISDEDVSYYTEKSIITNEDIVIEAEDYSDFLLKFFDMMENKIINSAEKIIIDKSYSKKSIGMFLKDLFNTVNTVAFSKQIKKYIKIDLEKGIVSAESELNVDIGFTDNYDLKLNQLASQQIDGYIINGKKWFGIKGITKELQASIIKDVQAKIKEGSSIKDIKETIKNNFNNFADWRSNMIARTETNRIINEGKMLGYKESGMKGKKIWKTAIDDRTSEICMRLHNKEVDLDSDFIDSKTNLTYTTPPAHPNCRSTIIFKPI